MEQTFWPTIQRIWSWLQWLHYRYASVDCWLHDGIPSRHARRCRRHVIWQSREIHAGCSKPTTRMQAYPTSTHPCRLRDHITRPNVEVWGLVIGGIDWQHWRIDITYRLLRKLDNNLVGEWQAISRTHLIIYLSRNDTDLDLIENLDQYSYGVQIRYVAWHSIRPTTCSSMWRVYQQRLLPKTHARLLCASYVIVR